MHIPSGTLIPDGEGSVGGGIIIVIIFLLMLSDSCERRVFDAEQISGGLDAKHSVYKEPILGLLTENTIVLQAQPRFVAREKFLFDTSNSAEVKIIKLSDNFANRFLNVIEQEIRKTELTIGLFGKDPLTKDFDEDIRKELLNTQKEPMALSQFYSMLAKQGHGQDGALLTDGSEVVFYIRTEDEPLTVHAYWEAVGWVIYTEGERRTASVHVRRDHNGILTFSNERRPGDGKTEYQLIFINSHSYQLTFLGSISDAPHFLFLLLFMRGAAPLFV